MQHGAIPTGKMFSREGAGAAWRLGAVGRAAYLAGPTSRMLALAHLKKGSRVLVVGGGTGDEAIAAARTVGPRGEVVLTDLSEDMVDEARKAIAEAGLEGIHCRTMDVQALDFPTATFDAVVGRNVLMFIPDLPRALAEVRRVLRPSGRFAATTWASGERNPRLSIPLEAARSIGVELRPDLALKLAVSRNRPDRLAAELRRAGFADVSVERVPAIARPVDWDAFREGIKSHIGTREVAQDIPATLQDRFWRSVDRRFDFHRSSGRMPGEQLVVAGTA